MSRSAMAAEKVRINGGELLDMIDFSELASLLSNTSDPVRSLDFTRSSIGDNGASVLARMLVGNTTLKKLNLFNNKITSMGAVAIGEILGRSVLEDLDLGSNEIGVVGVHAIAIGDRAITALKTLNLSKNSISDRGAAIIGAGLGTMRLASLEELNLSSNNITSEGAVAIAESIVTNDVLTSVHLKFNQVSTNGAIRLQEVLSGNRALTTFDLTGNQSSDDARIGLDTILKAKERSAEAVHAEGAAPAEAVHAEDAAPATAVHAESVAHAAAVGAAERT